MTDPFELMLIDNGAARHGKGNMYVSLFHPDIQDFYQQFILNDTKDIASRQQIEKYLDSASRACPSVVDENCDDVLNEIAM